MKNVMVVGCGAFMDSGYGCPGEWKCFKAACLGEGKYEEPSNVVGFVRCECPGRSTASNVGYSMQMSGMKPDAVYLSTCLVNAKPGCPHFTPDELAQYIQKKTGLNVIQGTHEY